MSYVLCFSKHRTTEKRYITLDYNLVPTMLRSKSRYYISSSPPIFLPIFLHIFTYPLNFFLLLFTCFFVFSFLLSCFFMWIWNWNYEFYGVLRSGALDGGAKHHSSIISRTLSSSRLCRGDPLIDKNALVSIDRRPSAKIISSSEVFIYTH